MLILQGLIINIAETEYLTVRVDKTVDLISLGNNKD